MSLMNEEKTARDTDMTHLSTWMLIIDNQALTDSLVPNAGQNSLPMTLKLHYGSKDVERHIYSNLTVKDFMQ